MDDFSVQTVQVAHALRDPNRDIHRFLHQHHHHAYDNADQHQREQPNLSVDGFLFTVNDIEQTATIAPFGDNADVGRDSAGADVEDDIRVSKGAEDGDFLLQIVEILARNGVLIYNRL